MRVTTTPATATHSLQRSAGLTLRIHCLVRPLAVSIALVTVMLTGAVDQADALVLSESTGGSGGSTEAEASLWGSGWYVVVGEGGKVYSPEAEAANPELAELWMGVAFIENEVASSAWYVIVGEGGRGYSPEAEAFNPKIAGLP